MKKILLLMPFILFFYMSGKAQLYLKNDSFKMRDDTTIDYKLNVKSNDSNATLLRIIEVVKLGASSSQYTLNISTDSNLVLIYSNDNTLLSGNFYYKVLSLNGGIDSAFVYFERVAMTADVYPGDCNNDNVVNHFDLFPIGMMYGQYGNPRHANDVNTGFRPLKSTNWMFTSGGINGKFADVIGDGVIDSLDMVKLESLMGNSRGNYTAFLSPASPSVELKLSIGDTIPLFNPTGSKSVPVIVSSSVPLSSYGIGYSFTMRVYNKSTGSDTFYPHFKYQPQNIWNDFKTLYIKDTISFPQHTNVAYSRSVHKNGGMDGTAGIIEIVTDDILIGLASLGDISYITIQLKEIALIDDKYVTIPISPVSKRIYFKKSTSGILSPDFDFKVYPTMIQNSFVIEKINAKDESYEIRNALGQIVQTGYLKSEKTWIENISFPAGVYFIRFHNHNQVYKILKNK